MPIFTEPSRWPRSWPSACLLTSPAMFGWPNLKIGSSTYSCHIEKTYRSPSAMFSAGMTCVPMQK